MAKRHKLYDVLRERDWSKTLDVFILNMMRCGFYSTFRTIDQGFSSTHAFENQNLDCIVGASIKNKWYFKHGNRRNIQVKYKVKESAEKLSKFLLKKNIIDHANYEDCVFKVYILQRGRGMKNVIIKDSEFYFPKKLENEYPQDHLWNYTTYEGFKKGELFITK